MIKREEIINLARKFEIDEYSILREYIQILFLRDFYSIPDSVNVYFKGSTLIHFLLHSFRFSEDLDFTVTTTKKEVKRMVLDTVEKSSLEAPGLELEHLSTKSISFTYRLNFLTELSIRPLTVKLEFSCREKPLTRKSTVIETEMPISPYPMVVHFDLEEILAEKVRAILTRTQGKDIFDCWYLLSKGVTFNTKFVEKKMSYYKKQFSVDKLRRVVEGTSIQSLKDDLAKFLPRSHRKMIDELKTMFLNKIANVPETS